MEEFDEQLAQLDQINLVINGMKTGSKEERALATAKADKMIANQSKVVINKTRINSSVSETTTTTNPTFAAMERDAQERFERKKKNRAEATKVKEVANEYFKKGDYESAEKEYTEALSLAPDVKVLYTNRALCRIRLGQFSEAIVDCDWAMRIEPDCVKARAQTGQAYAAMGEFEKAKEWFAKLPPKLAHTYVTRLEVEQREKEAAAAAKKLLKDDSPGELGDLKRIAKSLLKTSESSTFYEGGLLLLEKCLLANPAWSPLLLELIGSIFDSEHPIGQKFANQKRNAVTAAAWRLARVIGREVTSWSARFLADHKDTIALGLASNIDECIETLVDWSEVEILRLAMSSALPHWLSHVTSHHLLANLALIGETRRLMRNKVPPFANRLSTVNLYVNLAKDAHIRRELAKDVKLASLIVSSFDEKRNVSQLLALMINLMMEEEQSFCSDDIINILSVHLCSNDKAIHTRALGVAASLMTKHNRQSAAKIASLGLGRIMAGIGGEEEEIGRLCMRCLAAIAEYDQASRVLIGKFDPNLTRTIAALDADDDSAGNAALVIGACLGEDNIEVDVTRLIPKLLQLVDSCQNSATRKNVAIALSKAASLSDEAREVFRANHGLEILKSKMGQIRV